MPETYSTAEVFAFQIECENPNLIAKQTVNINQNATGHLGLINNDQNFLMKLNYLSKQLESIIEIPDNDNNNNISQHKFSS